MCGITGKVNFDSSSNINSQELKQMTDIIFHRGPDDEGYYINDNVGLGFRRLSIVNLTTGHQPVANENDSIFLIFNGEIYNYIELQEDLIKLGHIFKLRTEAETIVHLYEQYGTECIKYLRGMFAFCIWDKNKQQLFCVRDRFGIKPFFYYIDNDKFVFGSEIKSILQSKNIDKTLSNDAINSYFAFGYISSDLSIYDKIKKLQPGHYLLLSIKPKPAIVIHKYWDIHFEPDYSKSEKQWIDEIDASLNDAVKSHMISEVPMGAFLSGGVDSGSVVSIMAKNSNEPINTFSIGFKDEKFSELKNAREIAQKYGCNHHEQIVEPESIGLLSKLVSAYDEPFADSSAIPTYYVSKFAKEHVKMVLSGDGGDELFAGYNIYNYLQKIYRYNLTPSSFNKLVWGNINKIIPDKLAGKGLTYFLSKNRSHLGAYLCIWPAEERKKLILATDTFKFNNFPENYKTEILKMSNKNDFITNLQNLDMKSYLADDILTKGDRASKLSSLEVRVPILDHKFAELTFKIPSNLKLKGTEQKYIFRKAMRKYLPDTIINGPKKGFGIPLSNWFKEELKEYVSDTLLTGTPLLSKYLDQNYIKTIVEDHNYGKRDFSSRIWSLLFFEEWLQQNK